MKEGAQVTGQAADLAEAVIRRALGALRREM